MTVGKEAAKGAAKKRGLGRGLEALLGPKAAAEAPPLQAMPGDVLRTLPVDAMVPGKFQPRRTMDDAKLEELASSIRAQGVIQPIVVREHIGADGKGGRTYEIIAGERRWRASQRAGLSEVPVVIRVVDDRTVVAMALIENIQREDLNPLEEAQALQRLIDEFDLTHAQAAEAVGRSRAAVSNLLRLLELPPAIRVLVESKQLEMGHARALLALNGAVQTELARQVAQKGMTVRDTEKMVQRLLAPREERPVHPPEPNLQRWENNVSQQLGIAAKFVTAGKEKGKLVLSFQNQDELQKILQHFGLL